MSTHRPCRIDRLTAERLLRGERVEHRAELDPLTDLLAAAAAPPFVGDPAGEQAAVSAFRAARLGHIAQPQGSPVPRSLLSRLLTAKIAAAAIAVAGIGGVAVAAATDTLPTTPGGGAPAAVHPADAPSSAPAGDPAGPDTPQPVDGPIGNGGTGAGEHAAPSPSTVGLCRAYLAKRGHDPGHALDSPAFEELITRAGGEDQVTGYCATVLPSPPRPGEDPSNPGHEKADQRGNADRSAPPGRSTAPTSEDSEPSAENGENGRGPAAERRTVAPTSAPPASGEADEQPPTTAPGHSPGHFSGR